jgi:hypothetical protein
VLHPLPAAEPGPRSVEQGHSPRRARVRGLGRHCRDISKTVRQKSDELSDFGDRHANRASADIVVPGADYELPGLWVPSRPEVQTVPSSVLDEQATPGCELRHGHSMNPPDSDVECASDTERLPPASRSAQNAVTRNGRYVALLLDPWVV